MITYLPEIYPDELVYSWFSRYYVHSGSLNHKMALQDLLQKRSDNPSREFLGNLNPDAREKIQRLYPLEKLVQEHTMFPQYARFLPLTNRKKALKILSYESCDPHHLFSVLPRTSEDENLKYCPLCVREDRETYGEAYWHRSHQLRQVRVCHKHHCNLKSSTIPAKSEGTYTLCPAEEYVEETVGEGIDPRALEYTDYVTKVFLSPLNQRKDIPISSVLCDGMQGTPYLSGKGNMRFTKRLADDMGSFYGENAPSFHQIQRTLSGERFDFSVVCQIAFFLGISSEDLIRPKTTERQPKEKRETVNLDWNTLDDDLVPKLENLAKAIYTGKASKIGRPERVSERRIYKEMNLRAHSLENLPRCREVVNRYSETYEENWSRRILWALDQISKSKNHPILLSEILKLAGVKKEKLHRLPVEITEILRRAIE